MAKHRKEDRIENILTINDVSFGVKQLFAEHFENNLLNKILTCANKTKKQKNTNCQKDCKDSCNKKEFFLYENEQFGETNAFVVFHTEKDQNDKLFGWVDFVMVKRENRSEGLGTKLTELAIDYLQELGCLTISTTLLIPIGSDGEEGYPEYGSEEQLKNWGFSSLEQNNRYKYITIGDDNYKKIVYILV